MNSIGDSCFRFTHGIVRAPATSVTDGLRAGDGDGPDPARFHDEHSTYTEVLERCGLAVTRLPALEPFPDSVFVEDAAICLPSGAVALRPGAPSRAGEGAEMEPALRPFYPTTTLGLSAGTVDGGDVLVTGRELIIENPGRCAIMSAPAATATWKS